MKRQLELTAYLTNEWTPLRELYAEDGKALEGLIYSVGPAVKMKGWIKVGTAHATLELLPEKELVKDKIEDLNEQIKDVRARAENHIQLLTDRINSILALPNEVPHLSSGPDDIPF